MYAGKDMSGLRFGSLTVVSEDTLGKGRGGRVWNVVCDCGTGKSVLGASLRNGKSTSCGSCSHKTHGKSNTPTYGSWKSMIERCTATDSKDYPRYGGRGITVCERWLKFENFLEDMGERPEGKTLDRYPKQDGNYEPGNCRWATHEEQGFNRKTTNVIEFNGVSDSESGWARRLGMSATCLRKRLKKWSLERALTQPRTEEKVFKELIGE